MKASEARNLSDDEIGAKIRDLKSELFNLRFQAATGQIENPLQIRAVRKTIARLKTVQSERRLDGEE